MRGPHNTFRLIRTGATLERTGAMGVVLDAFDAPRPLRVVARVLGWPFRWLGIKGDPALPPVTRALTALGPAYIKFGQILSTRPDVVGDELAMQLRVLQDKLPPFPVTEARRVVAAELERPVETIFSEFSEPVAAASIAQVHKGRLAETGEALAIKVLRPGIERAFRKDIDAFYFAARMIETLSPASRRLRPMDVIEHFEGVVLGELDLRLETSSAAEFKANTAEDAGFQVPAVHWFLSSRRVMTLGWAEGIPAGEVHDIRAAGHDTVVLGERVLTLFLNHALRDGYFHADMHQGNLKIAANGDIIALDFGIMGRIDDVIVVAGHNLGTMEVESAVVSHPRVAEAAVVAVPDSKWGERPVAVVVARDGRTIDESALRAHLHERFEKFWLPDAFEVRDSIPRGATGKFLKRQLREELRPSRGSV